MSRNDQRRTSRSGSPSPRSGSPTPRSGSPSPRSGSPTPNRRGSTQHPVIAVHPARRSSTKSPSPPSTTPPSSPMPEVLPPCRLHPSSAVPCRICMAPPPLIPPPPSPPSSPCPTHPQPAHPLATYGLRPLAKVDQLCVLQQVEFRELFYEARNRYRVNSKDEELYIVTEESSFCSRQCLGSSRKIILTVCDTSDNEVFQMYRPFLCDTTCCRRGIQEMSVYCRCAQIGFVYQEWAIAPLFYVEDANEEVIFKITGPVMTFGNVPFEICTADGQRKIGTIKKHWSGFARELFTDADNFSICFPMELHVDKKALLLAALFLIDLTYFES